MGKAISILLIVSLTLCFASIEGSLQEEMLEDAPASVSVTPTSVSPLSYSRFFSSGILAAFPVYSDSWLIRPGKVLNYQFQYPLLPKGLISSLSLRFDNDRPFLTIDDQDQMPNTSILTGTDRLAISNALVPCHHDQQSYLVFSTEYSNHLLSYLPHWYPLVL